MEERYLYRAWDKARKEYLSAGNIFIAINAGSRPSRSEQYLDILRDPDMYKSRFVIQQCTGIKDQNGKLIFEGDIVSVYHKTKGIVRFGKYGEREMNYGFYIKWDKSEPYWRSDLCYWIKKIEVIGTVFDNPELLEVE